MKTNERIKAKLDHNAISKIYGNLAESSISQFQKECRAKPHLWSMVDPKQDDGFGNLIYVKDWFKANKLFTVDTFISEDLH